MATTQLAPHTLSDRFEQAVLANRHIRSILHRMASSDLPSWYLSGGCLFQTVWNVEHGFDPTHGILDYDVFYFDAADVSPDAERRSAERLALDDSPVKIDVRNQARVHLWYEREFGAPCPQFQRCEDGIDAFLATCCCFALRQSTVGLTVYAPFGFTEVFDLVVRPNPARVRGGAALASVYAAKTARWLQSWPRLRVLPWPSRAA
jgi:hypothetical protein